MRSPGCARGIGVGRQGAVGVDVVHPVQSVGLPAIDLEDHRIGHVQPGLVVAHRGGGHQQTVFANGGDLHHRHVDLAEEAIAHLFRQLAQVNVHVVQATGVDAAAELRIGLEGHSQLDAIDPRQGAVQLRCGGRAGQYLDAKGLADAVAGGDALGQGAGHGLGITGPGEAAHAHGHAVTNELRGLLGALALGGETGVANTVGHDDLCGCYRKHTKNVDSTPKGCLGP